MRKWILFVAAFFYCGAVANADSVSVLFDAGILRNADGSAIVPKGALCQILASPSGVFSTPTSSAYATGDNVVLMNFAMNYNSQIAGETLFALNSFTLTNTITAGEDVILRFYPTLTLASMPSTPTGGSSFGQVRSDTIEFGPAGGDGSETKWVLPSGGSSVDEDYITQEDGGTYANVTAFATGTVSAAPEPSSIAMLLGFPAFAFLRRRRSPAAA